MARFYRFFQLLAMACVVMSVAACSSPLDNPRRTALEDRARQAAATDMSLQLKPDLTLPAFLEVDYQGQDGQRVRQPACGGYCLRLLYSGEAKTVISGFAIRAPQSDCAALRQARQDYHDGKIKRLDFTHSEWDQVQSCDRLDKFMSGVTDTDPPRLWRGEGNAGRPYVVWARAYHVEKRKTCPGTLHTDTLQAYPNTAGDRKGASADTAADQNIAAGQCLIETPVNLDTASAIFVFSYEDEDIYDKKSPMRDTRFNASQLTVYGTATTGRKVIYRHTISHYAYLPVLAPGASFDSASFDIEKSSEPTRLLDHVRSDLALKLAEVPVAQVDYREAVTNALDNSDLDFISPNWNIVRDYLAALKAKGRNTLEPQDARLMARLIADRRVTVQLRDLEDIVRANPQAGPILAGPLLTELNAFPYKVLPNGSIQRLGNDEERQLLARQGGDHDDLLNAGSDRLGDLAAGLAALDDDSLRTHLPLYRQLADNPYRRRFYPSLVEHMNLLPPDEVLPTLRGLITPETVETPDHSRQDYLRLSALRAACRMGDSAASLLPDVIGFLKSTSEPENDGANAGSAEIAWAMLDHFHQVDALVAQLRPGKPYMTLIESGGLNCQG